jgi:4-amino-4-deoxy-L-arabinose transferase-like glycosyltransferase
MTRSLDRFAQRAGAIPLVLFGLLLRLPGLHFTVEHYGDAPVRVEAAERWAQAPHVFRGFSDAFQYGPVHLALIGLSLKLHPDRFLSPRLVSLAFGLLGIWLLFRLARRAAGLPAAWLAAAGLSLGTLHLQASTSAASEAVYLALLLACVELLVLAGAFELSAAPAYEGAAVVSPTSSRVALLTTCAALVLAAAGLVRYDGWMIAPLFCALLLLGVWKKRFPLWALVLFTAVCAAPALFWMRQNLLDSGEPLRQLRCVNEAHRDLVVIAERMYGKLGWRLYGLGYWPVNVLLLSSPLLGLFSMWGAGRVLWERARSGVSGVLANGWELSLLAWLPVVYFTFRTLVVGDFRPLSRFVMPAAALSLPFAWSALEQSAALLARAASLLEERAALWAGRLRAGLLVLSLGLAAATPLYFLSLSYHQYSNLAEWARPLSPISSVPVGIQETARLLRDRVKPGEYVLLDGVWHYLDIPIAFESGLPEEQLIRRSYDNFDQKLAQVGPPQWAVVISEGLLTSTKGAEGATWEAERFGFRGLHYCRVERFAYSSVFKLCP